MYTYFSIKTLWPEKQIKYASLLTKMQIGQFITGIIYTLYVQVLGNDCDSSASRITLAFIQLYVVGLIFLFMVFAKKKYSKKNDKREWEDITFFKNCDLDNKYQHERKSAVFVVTEQLLWFKIH